MRASRRHRLYSFSLERPWRWSEIAARLRLGVALLAAVVVCATAGTARAGTALIVTGHGWGHGVGMSQWGAYGYALHGWKYRRILSHYYPGTKMGRVGELHVRVLLDARCELRHGGLCHAAARHRRPASDPDAAGRDLRRRISARLPGAATWSRVLVRALRLARVRPRAAHASTGASTTGRSPSAVRAEACPSSTAFRSTRTSEASSRPSRRRTGPLPRSRRRRSPPARTPSRSCEPSSWYDLVPTTADQVYAGVSAEKPSSDHAVYATLGQVLTWDGQVARTYYSSSSGGRTEAVQDAWPGSAPIPYLRSVPDPYDTYSPHHDWGPYELSAGRLASRLGLAGPVESVRVERDNSSRAESAVFRLASGYPGHSQRGRRRTLAPPPLDVVLDR